MAYDIPRPGTLKRKRRRRADKAAISARIYLDSSLKGEIGVLSDDLIADLFPSHEQKPSARLYTAITPWTPHASPTDSQWAILPFRSQIKDEKPLPASTIRWPAQGSGTQSFVNLLQAVSPNKAPVRQNAAVEVRVSDVVPLALETVYVSVDNDAVKRLEEVQKRYGGGFAAANGHVQGKRAGKRATSAEESEEKAGEQTQKRLVHEALEHIALVHTGDFLPLALNHPVTHASCPPAKILACEPVSQGLLVPSTKVVITSASSERRQNHFGARNLMSPRLDEETEDDTSNEAFYSATESPMKPIVTSKSTTDLSNTEDLFDSSTEDSNLSDDSDDMISLTKPASGLTDMPSGMSSAITSATPRPFGAGRHTNGISTPGSVFSNVTASTVRGGQGARSKTFRAQGLLERIPDELLHPKPQKDEDEEARVYVDATALARLGCFSGDWVKLDTATQSNGLPDLSAFGSLNGLQALQASWRPVKVYGLPESMSKRPAPRYQLNTRAHDRRRESISSIHSAVTTTGAAGAESKLYLSPVLLANLGQPESVSLSPLPTAKRPMKRPFNQRPTSSASPRQPPTASEVTLRKIVTPLSSERALQNVLLTNLKEHFERRQRVVKAGDLIAIPVDESLGRSLYEGGAEQDDGGVSALLAQADASEGGSKNSRTGEVGVAWFTIESVNVPPSEESEGGDALEGWAGAASIDPTRMTMRQSGDDRRRLPTAEKNSWMWYLGVRSTPPRSTTSATPHGPMPEAPRAFISPLQRRLRELISVSTSPRAVHLGLPPLALLLTSTQRSIGKTYTVQRVCADLGLHYFPISAYDISSQSSSGSNIDTEAQGLLEARCERALDCGAENTVICIKHMEVLASERVVGSLKSVLERARVLVATSVDVEKIGDGVRSLFTHELEMTAPDEGEREGILKDIVSESGIPLAPDVDLSAIAVKTAALVAGDLVDVVDRAIVARADRLDALAKVTSSSDPSSMAVTVKDIHLSGGAAATSIIPADFETAVDLARKNFADAIGAPKIPNVQWSDVGGLTHVKDAVSETIQLPLSRPDLFAKGLKKRSGILFYGPPGTGKTLLAKAIATEFSLNFFSVKGPELLNMYIGESEANVRRVFQRARDARPCVVFFDELDSVAPKRGNQGDSGGVMDRIVSQLLAELDGMSDGEDGGGGVFVIGATNRPDLLDQALLRPGRFDKMLYLGISDTHDKQATILQALTRKFKLDPELSLARVAEQLPFTFTGADLYALCSDAMLKAVTRSARLVDEKLEIVNSERVAKGQSKASVAYYFDHCATDDDTEVSVTEEDFLLAKRELVPSVSLDELRHYERVRDTFEGAAKKPAPGKESNGGEDTAGSRPSTARSGGGEVRGVSRKLVTDMMKRGPSSKEQRVNGSRPQVSHAAAGGTVSDADEDFVAKTERMALNGVVVGGRPLSSKGKGKGKAVDLPMSLPDGPVEANGGLDGEDLYD